MKAQNMQPAEDYVSVAEAAATLKIGIGTLRARIKRGKLPVHYIVGRQAITRAQLDELQKKGFRKRKKSSGPQQ